jgi:hypothetical protein
MNSIRFIGILLQNFPEASFGNISSARKAEFLNSDKISDSTAEEASNCSILPATDFFIVQELFITYQQKCPTSPEKV